MAAPKCLNCNKTLRKHTLLAVVPRGEPPPRTFRDRTVVACVRTSEPTISSTETWHSVWLGDYGAYADNFFCGRGCGYHYGVRAARNRGFR